MWGLPELGGKRHLGEESRMVLRCRQPLTGSPSQSSAFPDHSNGKGEDPWEVPKEGRGNRNLAAGREAREALGKHHRFRQKQVL